MAALTATAIPQVGAAKLLGFVVAVILVVQLVRNTIRRSKTTQLPGPPSPNRLFGITSLLESNLGKTGELYDGWAEQYGPVYKVPTQLGGNKIVLYDPKAIAYFNAHETTKFLRSGLSRRLIEQGLGHGLLWAEGDDHKRKARRLTAQRKALSPAFSNAAVRNVTSVFFDSGYKVKTAWDNIIQNSGKDSAVIDVAKWLGHVSLDSIGIAGFGYNFGTLEGRPSAAADAFEAFSDMKPTALEVVVMMLAFVFPILSRIPFKGRRLTAEVNRTLGIIGEKLLDNTRNEKWQDRESNAGEDKSIIGLLLKAEKSQGGGFTMTKEEIVDQESSCDAMKLLIFAGYDTTSIVLTWALLELCRHPDVQTRLRKELEQFSGTDPTYEELMHGLPYLDAIVHETLRLHGPVSEAPRVAASDEVIPLSQPLTLPSGEIVNNIVVCKGQLLTMSIHGINRSPAFWGPDAKAFKPERWLNPEGTPLRAQEIQGHRHLLTFSDGPRICIGRAFALAEFKSVLSVLIRNYAFEFKSGIEPEIDTRRALLPRPGMKGEPGVSIPLVVSRLD